MDSKLTAQVFSDIIASTTLEGKATEALLYAMKELWCKSVSFGSYGCYEKTAKGFPVDGCLVAEIDKLVKVGIKTIGCCCGHGKRQGYIQVAPESVGFMKNLGYEQLPLDADDNGQWCFKPKTLLP